MGCTYSGCNSCATGKKVDNFWQFLTFFGIFWHFLACLKLLDVQGRPIFAIFFQGKIGHPWTSVDVKELRTSMDMSKNAKKCQKMTKNVKKCQTMSKIVKSCLRTSKDVKVGHSTFLPVTHELQPLYILY